MVVPLAIPIAALRTCIGRQCCVPRFKQPIGELIMVTIITVIYIGTVVGVILPKVDDLLELKAVGVVLKAILSSVKTCFRICLYTCNREDRGKSFSVRFLFLKLRLIMG